LKRVTTFFNAKGVVTRFNGTFYFPDHDGIGKSGTPGLGALMGMEGLGE